MRARQRHVSPPLPHLAASLLTESFATFALTLVDGGIGVINEQVTDSVGLFGKIIAPGVVVPAMIFIFGETSGASMNPARSLGPSLMTGHFSQPWIYLVIPLIGSETASGFSRLVRGAPTNKEMHSAQGGTRYAESRV